MDSRVQTESFGVDSNFRKAVYELISADDKGEEYRSKSLERAEELQARAFCLLKRYRTLQQTKLYRYLQKTKPVSNPLNETNILILDKYYSVIFKLWKTIHHIVTPKPVEKENQIAFDDTCNDYQQFCATLCGFAAHVLGFELIEDGHYQRTADNIDLVVHCSENSLIKVVLKDTEPRSVFVPAEIDIPIAAGMSYHGISYDGHSLIWPNDITEDEIESFCSIFKTRGSRGKEQNEEKRKYAALKSLLDQAQRSYDKPRETSFTIIPAAIEIGVENRTLFKTEMEAIARKLLEKDPNEQIVVAVPLCNENEQKITEYAKEDGQVFSLLPLTMFDINSFRRLQNMLYRQILKLNKSSCPNCGSAMRKRDKKHENQLICDNCNQLMLTRTICPNPECKHEYLYMSYDVPETTLQKMQSVKQESFFKWDSLFQYKDIVNMTVSSGKVRTICPFCHRS